MNVANVYDFVKDCCGAINIKRPKNAQKRRRHDLDQEAARMGSIPYGMDSEEVAISVQEEERSNVVRIPLSSQGVLPRPIHVAVVQYHFHGVPQESRMGT
jgi:hypothetical protein